MRKLAAVGALIGMVLLMGCLETRTFTKTNEGMRPMDLGSIGTVNATNERYTVSTENAWYDIMSMPLNEDGVQYVLGLFSEMYSEGELDGRAVYFTYTDSERTNINSIIWYDNGVLYLANSPAPEANYDTLYALFKFYNGI